MASEIGRPTDYKVEFNEQARKLCLLGYTDKQLADFFGICESTLNVWKKKHPLFMESLKAGKECADAELALTLYKRAKGGLRVTKQRVSDGAIVDIEEELPPDVTALIFWLKNRQPNIWRERTEQRVVLSDDFEEVMNAKDDDEPE